MSRLLVVSNRLPVTVEQQKGALHIKPSSGGLATGLRTPHERSDGLWLGWPGDVSGLSNPMREDLEGRLAAMRAVPIYLTASEVTRFYDGFANGVLWPLFHYLPDRLPLRPRGWEAYQNVNQRFCDLVASHYRPGDMIWVHDYQLMLVPAMLRKRLPGAKIGFFLHIPFPAADMFRILPWRQRILEGIVGADLVGFHTFSYRDHFSAALLQILGLTCDVDRISYRAREVRLGVFPMGVDAGRLSRSADSDEVVERTKALRQNTNDVATILGVDRLDYTKGIPRRLLAIERLLEKNPALRGRVRFTQVAVPSRMMVDAYAETRKTVDELVGRINGMYSTLSVPPIHYLYRSLSESNLLSLYRAADVMLVTPLRDGMNLVAKEFIAARNDEDGVLVLSELAGAAPELPEALQVNPYDIDGVAMALKDALRMPVAERTSRMRALRGRVLSADVHRWAASFIEQLSESSRPVAATGTGAGSTDVLTTKVRQLALSDSLLLLLDYDGTLVPFAIRPELAVPDVDLLELLRLLCGRKGTDVHIVSGRARESLERWLGHLPLSLHAEHGFWSRLGSNEWVPAAPFPTEALKRVRPIFEEFARRTPGSFVEDKSASMTWHYRAVEPELGQREAGELRTALLPALANSPLQVLPGDHVVEVRLHGVDKGVVTRKLVEAQSNAGGILCLGDDTTDEDMFAALPESAVSVHVGKRESRAVHRLRDPAAARRLLWTLAADG